MYILPTKELRQFFSASSFIKNTGTLPVLAYMKIKLDKEGSSLYRTNLDQYYIHYIDVQNSVGEIMVEYTSLADFVSKISSDSITLTPKGNTVIISDGKTKIISTIMDNAVFPVVPKINNEGITLSEEMIFSLKRASKFLNEDKNDLFTTHVFVGKSYICASDRNFAHYAPMETPIEAPLYRSIVDAIPGACTFSLSDNYYTFTTLTGTYLFIKSEASFFDMTKVPQSRPIDETCTVSKKEFLSWLTIARGQCKYNLCLVEIKGSENSMYCLMNDPLSTHIVDITLESDGEPFEFKFNADYMITMCKQFTGETLFLYVDGPKLFIRDENNNFLTIIMKVG